MNAKKLCSASSWLTALVAVVFAFLAGTAAAEIVSTEEAAQQSDRERVREFLKRDEVADHLQSLGVAPEEARRRADALTPEEVQVVAGKMDTLAAGGALSSTDWIIILLIVIIVLLIV
jgi:hypothetical protein